MRCNPQPLHVTSTLNYPPAYQQIFGNHHQHKHTQGDTKMAGQQPLMGRTLWPAYYVITCRT